MVPALFIAGTLHVISSRDHLQACFLDDGSGINAPVSACNNLHNPNGGLNFVKAMHSSFQPGTHRVLEKYMISRIVSHHDREITLLRNNNGMPLQERCIGRGRITDEL
jgi:hypothetical protein